VNRKQPLTVVPQLWLVSKVNQVVVRKVNRYMMGGGDDDDDITDIVIIKCVLIIIIIHSGSEFEPHFRNRSGRENGAAGR